MKKIDMKNYIVYAFICIATILLLVLFVNMYNSNKKYQNETNERMSFLKEITFSIYEDYVIENPNYILYISDGSELFEELENNLRDQLISKDYVNDIIYFNSYKDGKKLLKKINKEYKLTLDKLPNLIIVSENKIVNTYYIDKNSNTIDIINMIESIYD